MRLALLIATIPLAFFSDAGATETQSEELLRQPFSLGETRDTRLSTTANPLGTLTTRHPIDGPPSTTQTTIGAVSISTELRRLPEHAVAVSDDHGGWRLEKRHVSGTLSSVQDTHGLVVDIVRAAGGRPVGLLLGEHLAVEYVYSPGAGPWMRKVVYDLNTGEQFADVTNEGRMVEVSVQPADLSVSSEIGPVIEQFETYGGGWHLVSILEGRRYALLPLENEGRVIRSVSIDGPLSSSIGDRIDYTDSEFVIHLATGDNDRTVVVAVAAPRSTSDDRTPVIIEDDQPEITSYLAVLSVGTPPRARIPVEPALNGTFDSSVTEKLYESFAYAIDKVRKNPSCLGLFEEFLVSGVERLESTYYAPPSPERTYGACDRGALAYTHVGSPVTHLCSSFGTVTRKEAAVVLIHEALHFAGLPEAPSTPGALTSTEINLLVLEACGF